MKRLWLALLLLSGLAGAQPPTPSPAPVQVMPQVEGITYERAVEAVRAAGGAEPQVVFVHCPERAGRVERQVPAPGTPVAGRRVVLTVARAAPVASPAAPAPTPPPSRSTGPNWLVLAALVGLLSLFVRRMALRAFEGSEALTITRRIRER